MRNTNYELNEFVEAIEQKLRKDAFDNQYYYENEYLHKHNHTCPLCKKPIKVNFKKVLTGVGIVGLIRADNEKMAYSYTLCKRCSKKLAANAAQDDTKSIILSHILSTIY